MSRPPDTYVNSQDKRHIIDKEDVFDQVCLCLFGVLIFVFIDKLSIIEVVFLCNILNQLNTIVKTLLVSYRKV